MIIDIETHPLRFARNGAVNPQMSMIKHYTWCEQSPDLLVAEMEYAGVDKAFLISYDAEDIQWGSSRKGFDLEDYSGGRKYSLLGFRRYPERFYWFNTLKNPKRHDVLAQVRRDFAEGASGVKVFAAYIQVNLLDEAFIAVCREIMAQGKVLLLSFQTLRPPDSYTLEEYLEQLDGLLQLLPGLPLVLMQAGCADPLTPRWDQVRRIADKHEKMIMGCGFVGEIWDDETEYPFPNYLGRIRKVADAVGTGRMMWGTDWPWFEDKFKYRQAVDSVRKHAGFWTMDQRMEFLGGTAARLMGVK
ncbi:amidohydrolase family protein [Ferrovibrio sp.]|uniref:amidohydrolase family protein n=1 Tax=Ferrovibrio sp. TaxID=1917215 RepID=UPI003D14C2B5